MKSYKKTLVKVMVVLLLIFGALFFSSLRAYLKGDKSVFNLGIPGENLVVMALSVVAIFRVVYLLYKIEDY